MLKVSLVSMILATMALSILFENVALIRWGGYGKSVPAFTGEKVAVASARSPSFRRASG